MNLRRHDTEAAAHLPTPHAYDPGKRLLDLALGVPALVLSTPIQLVVAAVVRLDLGAPVLFRQVRPGRDGKPFTLLKFRTMHACDPSKGHVDDASRLTSVGRFLRSTSLDELPTLLNVVAGDMSLVGPRPLLLHYLPLYSPEQSRRHEVRPGVTGLAQVTGRNAVAWSERLRLDVAYVDARCLRLDLQILLRTVGAVFRRTGISAAGAATMPEFVGGEDVEAK